MIVIGGNGGGTISDAGSVVEVEPVGAEVVAGTVVVVVVVVEVVAGTVVEAVVEVVGEVVVGGAEVGAVGPASYTHPRAHETGRNLVCRLLLEKIILL